MVTKKNIYISVMFCLAFFAQSFSMKKDDIGLQIKEKQEKIRGLQTQLNDLNRRINEIKSIPKGLRRKITEEEKKELREASGKAPRLVQQIGRLKRQLEQLKKQEKEKIVKVIKPRVKRVEALGKFFKIRENLITQLQNLINQFEALSKEILGAIEKDQIDIYNGESLIKIINKFILSNKGLLVRISESKKKKEEKTDLEKDIKDLKKEIQVSKKKLPELTNMFKKFQETWKVVLEKSAEKRKLLQIFFEGIKALGVLNDDVKAIGNKKLTEENKEVVVKIREINGKINALLERRYVIYKKLKERKRNEDLMTEIIELDKEIPELRKSINEITEEIKSNNQEFGRLKKSLDEIERKILGDTRKQYELSFDAYKKMLSKFEKLFEFLRQIIIGNLKDHITKLEGFKTIIKNLRNSLKSKENQERFSLSKMQQRIRSKIKIIENQILRDIEKKKKDITLAEKVIAENNKSLVEFKKIPEEAVIRVKTNLKDAKDYLGGKTSELKGIRAKLKNTYDSLEKLMEKNSKKLRRIEKQLTKKIPLQIKNLLEIESVRKLPTPKPPEKDPYIIALEKIANNLIKSVLKTKKLDVAPIKTFKELPNIFTQFINIESELYTQFEWSSKNDDILLNLTIYGQNIINAIINYLKTKAKTDMEGISATKGIFRSSKRDLVIQIFLDAFEKLRIAFIEISQLIKSPDLKKYEAVLKLLAKSRREFAKELSRLQELGLTEKEWTYLASFISSLQYFTKTRIAPKGFKAIL